MKANELMVGDYLMHNGFPYRVIQVDGIVRDGWMIENGEEDCGEPIPLTPETLEKNGFSADYCNDDLSYAQSCGDVIGIHIYGKNGLMDEMYFKYVHQLQHALRLCGIEKEIEL